MFVVTGVSVFGQPSYKTGSIAQINVNVRIAENWKLNTKLEARQIFREKQPEAPLIQQVKYERTDLVGFLPKRFRLIIQEAGETWPSGKKAILPHRLIQQFSSVKDLEVFINAHRIVLDETFSSGTPPEFRLRYRFGAKHH